MSRSRVVLSPSRFDRTPMSLFRAVKTYLYGADTIVLTEVSGNARVRRLRHIPGWRFCQIEGPDGRDECAILTKRTKWRVDRILALRLSDTPLPTREGQHVWALVVVRTLRWRPKVRVVDMAVHFPAHHDMPIQRKAWEESTQEAASVARFYLDRGFHVRISADVNKDYRSGSTARILRARFAPLTCNWAGRIPKEGTYKNRLIDQVWSNMRCDHSYLMTDDPSSDHRPFKARHLL